MATFIKLIKYDLVATHVAFVALQRALMPETTVEFELCKRPTVALVLMKLATVGL